MHRAFCKKTNIRFTLVCKRIFVYIQCTYEYVCTEKKLRSLLCRESRMKMFVIPKINVFLVRERDCRKSEGYSIFVYFQKL